MELILAQSKFDKRARSESACQFYLLICLFKTGGSLVPNQSPLQTESQSKTCTLDLWAETARPKDNSSKNLTTSKI